MHVWNSLWLWTIFEVMFLTTDIKNYALLFRGAFKEYYICSFIEQSVCLVNFVNKNDKSPDSENLQALRACMSDIQRCLNTRWCYTWKKN